MEDGPHAELVAKGGDYARPGTAKPAPSRGSRRRVSSSGSTCRALVTQNARKSLFCHRSWATQLYDGVGGAGFGGVYEDGGGRGRYPRCTGHRAPGGSPVTAPPSADSVRSREGAVPATRRCRQTPPVRFHGEGRPSPSHWPSRCLHGGAAIAVGRKRTARRTRDGWLDAQPARVPAFAVRRQARRARQGTCVGMPMWRRLVRGR